MKRSCALDDRKIGIIKVQAEAVRHGRFFLAGGTAAGIRFDHRASEDLDWFTGQEFDADKLRRSLEKAAVKPAEIEQSSAQTLRAYYGDFETSFILYRQIPTSTDEIAIDTSTSVPVATVELLAGMKAAAVHDRGSKRDFLDIYAISKQPAWSIARFIEHASGCLPLQPEQVARALTYFFDADRQPMPPSCKYTWEAVKKELIGGVRAWERGRGVER